MISEAPATEGAGPATRLSTGRLRPRFNSYRPFPCLQPDAQCGPIFLHAEPCALYVDEAVPPPMLLARRQLLICIDSADDRIVYGTGRLVAGGQLAQAAAERLPRTDVACVHVRCAANDCDPRRIARG